MKISAIDITRLAVPIRRPIRTSVHDFTHAHTVLVRLRTEVGLTGMGWCFAFEAPKAAALAALVEDLAPLYQGRDPRAVRANFDRAWRDHLNTLKTAQRRGRVRSPETQELIEAIDSLVPGAAKAVVVESGQTPQKVRARVMYAGKAAGKKLQAAISGNKVLFALKEERRRPGRPRKNPV